MNIEEKSIHGAIVQAKKLFHMHFADSNRLAPGLGHLDFKRILDMLRKAF